MFIRFLLAVALLSLSTNVFARTCPVTIQSDDQMKFDLAEIRIAADCTQVALTLTHTGKLPANAMGHNWVLTRTDDYRDVAIAGGRAGLADSYLPKGDARVIAYTRVIGGGESVTLTFPTARLEGAATTPSSARFQAIGA